MGGGEGRYGKGGGEEGMEEGKGRRVARRKEIAREEDG